MNSAPPGRSLEEVIGEERFGPLLGEKAKTFFRLANYLRHVANGSWSKKVYGQISTDADDLESFLDDFGARNNRAYSTFAELIASVRNFGRVGHGLSHVLSRIPLYALSPENAESLSVQCRATLAFCDQAIRRLLDELCAEAARLGISIPSDRVQEENLRDRQLRRLLPHNADEADVQEEERRVAEVTSRVIEAVEVFERVGIRRIDDFDGLRRFVEAQCDEEKARKYESIVHSLQSKYDTFVKNTGTEARFPALPSLRGEISVALHLLEIVTDLVHFYERHENDIRNDLTRDLIARIVDKRRVLDCAVNFGLNTAAGFLLRARDRARELLPHFLRIREVRLCLPEGVRLHARPAALIVAVVNHYGTPVTMEIAGRTANARSIMQVMMLAGSAAGTETISFRGDERPLEDLKLLFDHRLGESGRHTLPAELGYLQEAVEPR
jgi:phosphotransferase system HPr (HPr) family protein